MDEQREAADARLEGALGRVPVAVKHIEGLMAGADPELLPGHALGQLEDPLNRAIGALETLAADPEQIVALDGAIDDALASSQLLASMVRVPEEINAAAAESFGKALRRRAQELEAETDAINQKLEEAKAEQVKLEEEGKAAFDQRRADLQGEFDRVSDSIKTEQGRLDQLIPQFEERFTESQGDWSEEWKAIKSGLEENAANTQREFEQKAADAAGSLTGQADEVLAEIRKKRDEVAELYRVVTDTSSSGAFAAEADEQKKAADKWRWVAVIGGVVTIALAVVAVVFSAVDKDGSISSHLTSLVVAAAAGGLTAYAARQSGHHRDREDETRRLALELAAFGPFTSELVDTEKVRAEYVERLFKGAEHERRDDGAIGKDQVSLLQTIVESLMKVRA